MAIDHALLDAVDEDPALAVFRTYEWDEPTLSLGYFQRFVAVETDPQWHEVRVVRRPTGGGAIWHDHEVTYALVMPRSHPAACRPADLYRLVHGAIAAELRGRGLAATLRGRLSTEAPAGDLARPFLCFLDHDPSDVLLDGRKVLGSAQRRRPRAVLQHGSLLLASSGRTPELPGLRELAGAAWQPRDWAGELSRRLPTALGLTAIDSTLTPDECRAADRLAREVYADVSWTRRR
jgi:lipoate-protein ligase A